MTLDIDRLLTELTLEEKASLTSGSGFWYTKPIERLGIPKIMVSDGPHGLRAQPGEGDHLGIGGIAAGDLLPHRVGARARPGTPNCCGGSARRWRRRPGPATCR